MPIADITLSLLQSIGLMALLSVVYGMLLRTRLGNLKKSLTTGLLFGAGAVLAMLAPTELPMGGIIDGRAVFVGLGAAFGGIPAAIVAAAIGIAFRLYVGGGGVVVGAAGIALAAAIGMLWAHYCPSRLRPKLPHLAVAGALISLHFFVVYLRPFDLANQLMLSVYPILLVSSVLSAVILGMLVERERRLIESEEALKHAADIDYLTGLANRRHFHNEYLDAGKRATAGSLPHTIAVFDLDRFKRINDKWGHEAGDRALVAFADTLRRQSRSGDMVARFGGEEFVIFMKETCLVDAEMTVERILAATRALVIDAAEGSFSLTVSAGVIEFDSEETPLALAMDQADQALYRAKQGGRDQLKTALFDKAA